MQPSVSTTSAAFSDGWSGRLGGWSVSGHCSLTHGEDHGACRGRSRDERGLTPRQWLVRTWQRMRLPHERWSGNSRRPFYGWGESRVSSKRKRADRWWRMILLSRTYTRARTLTHTHTHAHTQAHTRSHTSTHALHPLLGTDAGIQLKKKEVLYLLSKRERESKCRSCG